MHERNGMSLLDLQGILETELDKPVEKIDRNFVYEMIQLLAPLELPEDLADKLMCVMNEI